MKNSREIAMRKAYLREKFIKECENSIDEKIRRYLEIKPQDIIGNHYFSAASTECIKAHTNGQFISAIVLSHAVNEGILKFICETMDIPLNYDKCNKKSGRIPYIKLLRLLRRKGIISKKFFQASQKITTSFRNDYHHMNPKIKNIDHSSISTSNLIQLSIIENEIFGYASRGGKLIPNQPIYWPNIENNGTVEAFLRLGS